MYRVEIANGLRAARAQIDEHGWGKGAYMTVDGCLCAIGAINMATGGMPGPSTNRAVEERAWALRGALAEALPIEGIATFNDWPGRRRDQVTDAFACAAWLTENDPDRWAAG